MIATSSGCVADPESPAVSDGDALGLHMVEINYSGLIDFTSSNSQFYLVFLIIKPNTR